MATKVSEDKGSLVRCQCGVEVKIRGVVNMTNVLEERFYAR